MNRNPKVLIAEDETPQRAELERLLQDVWPRAEVIASCADGLEALEAYEAERPDVAFLDLRMPGAGGLELARAMTDAMIVFVTAYDDAAVRAFEEGAVDYLLKPVRRERLALAVTRLESRLTPSALTGDTTAGLGGLSPAVFEAASRARGESRQSLRWITASVGDTVRLYPIEDVLLFQAQDKYTRVLTASGEAIIRTSLRELVRMLDPEIFWHVHRSVLVRGMAIDCIRRDEAGKYTCTLKGRSETFPVSSAFQRTLRAM
ncbi:Response regulator of the LytR/AlgR family [Labilithrix luteola]|uniref:Response regulator of the LytR/AlgR family n=1 Tax=Labilithrix luteola TaxID=1391654 RepID=A0A0K1PZK5_9BACT|nr:LytTR family DNA-binding domain-containing protein [Labilithrix luteola]AKU98958.1 Response regulator of the LytR/AlgR family [Labilithrix luteola]